MPGITLAATTAPAPNQPAIPHADCVQKMLAQAKPNTTLGELRKACDLIEPDAKTLSETALRRRLMLEEATELNPFVITPHKRNYIMPFSYWSDPYSHKPEDKSEHYRHLEAKFQLSFKVPIVKLWDDAQLYGAFTGTFFWQSYSGQISRPFREINYMPEVFITQPFDWDFGPIDSKLLIFGAVHQSNGQDVPRSRSWNRIYVDYVFQTGSYYWSIKPWWRIPEENKDNPLDRHGDDNPDIEDYLGRFELRVSRPFNNHVVELMLRNNLHRHGNKGAAQIDYTFPINDRFKGIIQAFTGYGDSLIDYNEYQNRISIGILLTDTL